jgi:hypothetical protein
MALSGGFCRVQIFLIWAGWSILAGSSVVWAGSVNFGGKLYLLFGRVRSILAGSVLRNSLYVGIQ